MHTVFHSHPIAQYDRNPVELAKLHPLFILQESHLNLLAFKSVCLFPACVFNMKDLILYVDAFHTSADKP